MKYSIIIFIALFNTHLSIGQPFAVVKDNDGYANIRNNEGVVVDKLLTNKAVFCLDPEENSDWISIDYNRGGVTESGSIHKSQLIYLSKYEKIPILKEESESVVLTNGKIRINIKQEKFTPKNNNLSYHQDGYLILINNKNAWGADGNVPREQYKSITLSISSQKVFFPKSAFEDTFSPNLSNTQAFYDKESDRLYLSAFNGDGAGGYVVLWVFKNGIYEDRLITHGI